MSSDPEQMPPAAARAFTVDRVAGIAIGLNAVVTAVLAPLVLRLF